LFSENYYDVFVKEQNIAVEIANQAVFMLLLFVELCNFIKCRWAIFEEQYISKKLLEESVQWK